MKKSLFFLIVNISLLFSCGGNKFYSVSITNSSADKSVSYTYNDISDTLDVSETKIYRVEAYTQPPENITDQDGIASMRMEQDNMTGNYTFFDANPLDLKVINELPVIITIKADNFIDNNGSMELTIGPRDESTGAYIFTNNPNFTSTSDYPIAVVYTVVENEMLVIIR